MSRGEWLSGLSDKSLDELYELLREEHEAMRDIKSDRNYEGKWDHVVNTRENIQRIHEAIDEKKAEIAEAREARRSHRK